MPSLKNKRIALFGGAFDPPHRGHEKALSAFMEETEADLVYVIPSGTPPHKKLSRGAEDEHRLAMSRLSFGKISDKVFVSDMEIRSPEVSYTLLTVQRLKEMHPQSEIFLFVGTDQFLAFETWKEPQALLNLCTLCVMDRFSDRSAVLAQKAALEEKFSARCLLLDEKAYIMSSTEIRRDLKENGYSYRLSPEVLSYVSEKGLYEIRKDEVREQLLLRLQKEISPIRLAHVLSVEREAAELSALLGAENERDVRLAALYHDLTKEKSVEEQILLAKEFGITFSPEDLSSPAVLHGMTAALLARRDGYVSEEACRAIEHHTMGAEKMSLSEKILYFADYIEETRPYPACRLLRQEFYGSFPEEKSKRPYHLNQCVYRAMEDTVKHLKEKERAIHPQTVQAMNDLGKEIL